MYIHFQSKLVNYWFGAPSFSRSAGISRFIILLQENARFQFSRKLLGTILIGFETVSRVTGINGLSQVYASDRLP